MTPGDLVRLGLGNLRRQKLRTALTVAGIVIAMGAFVSMLSFGAGNQRLVSDQFEELGLLGTMVVRPPEPGTTGAPDDDAPDADDPPPGLGEEDLRWLETLPGVRLAYPYDDFDVTITLGDSTIAGRAQALDPAVLGTRLFSRYSAGGPPPAGDEDWVLVREDVLEELGLAGPDSLPGRPLRVAVRAASPDSGFARLFERTDGTLRVAVPAIDPDSIGRPGYVRAWLQREAGATLARFLDGYLEHPAEIADTLTVAGVLKPGRRLAPVRDLVIPLPTARRFAAAGPGSSPTELLPALLDGRIFGAPADPDPRRWSQITLDLEPWANHVALVDSIEARGWRPFSYAAEFREIRRILLLFNLGIGAVGLVALATAALGIVNTMLMSVSERRREIGILRSLGADEHDIRFLFLVESGLIGAIGAALGVVLGWTVARIGARVARELMIRQDVPPLDLFSTPLWLVALALAFGTLVSVAAGALPAARAARLDPVRALREE